ncbi:hypothetical protein JCM16303_002489 [Sporobolomyces ruberrimus]
MKVSRRRPSSSDASNDAIVERVNNADRKSSQSTLNTHYDPLKNEKAFRVPSDEKKGRSIWTYVGLALILVAAMVLVVPWSGERSSNSLKPRSRLPEDVATSVVREADSPSSSIGPAASWNDAVQLKSGKARQEDDACFPLRSGLVSTSGPPGLSRDEWWCKDSELYGFLGFSYPLEVVDCSNPWNQFDKINGDLKRMKDEFGATMVRPYAVSCREVSIWENLVRACAENGMGLVVQVWWGFDKDQSLWEHTQASLYKLFESSSVSAIAPYIVHSASFGSEPIGDGVLGDDFISKLAAFRSKMNSFGIPVGISEDWDRPQLSSGGKLTSKGRNVLKNTDIAHLHVMPHYHPDTAPFISDAWPYAAAQIAWARENLKQPTLVTQTMWSSEQGGLHARGGHDEEANLAAFTTYWDAFSSNCGFFKFEQVGWFVHVFDDSQESFFGMIGSDGKSKIKGWKPQRC